LKKKITQEQENEELFKSYSKNPKKIFLPNGEKLSMPFNLLEQIGYELSDSDRAIINTRNNFLHGSTPEYELDSDKDKKIDYKDVETLKKYTTERGKILPRRVTGTCAMHQRAVTSAIKRARVVALMPFDSEIE